MDSTTLSASIIPAGLNGSAVPPPSYFVEKEGRKTYPSGRSPNKISTVLTNVQRRNIKTSAPPVSEVLSIHQRAAQGELILLEEALNEENEHRSNVDLRDDHGLTPLLWACANGQKASVELLLSRNADINVIGDNGENALLLATCYGHREIVSLLLNRGMDVNYTDELGNTALMFAAYNNHAQCALLLLEWGSDITMENEDRITAIDIVYKRRNRATQQVLEKHIMNALTKS